MVDVLNWAHQHLERAAHALHRYESTNPYSVKPERRDDGRRYVFTLRVTHEPKAEISLMLSDFLYNARAVLDHLLYAIAAKPYNGRLPLEEARKIQFPICDTPEQFENQKWRLALLPKEVQAEIEGLQAFRDGIDSAFCLYMLRDLTNFAKHRELPILAAEFGAAVLHIPEGSPQPESQTFLTDGAELAEVTFAHPIPPVDMKVELRVQFVPCIRTHEVSEMWSSEHAGRTCLRIEEYLLDTVLHRFQRHIL